MRTHREWETVNEKLTRLTRLTNFETITTELYPDAIVFTAYSTLKVIVTCNPVPWCDFRAQPLGISNLRQAPMVIDLRGTQAPI